MPTSVKLCWDAFGLHFKGNATDDNVYNSATNCNDPPFSDGDVMEVFVSPVRKLSDTPSTYLELDTAAVSGALWGMLTSNPVRPGPDKHTSLGVGGDTQTLSCDKLSSPEICTSTGNASGMPCDLGAALNACLFSCTGANTFVHGMTVSVSQGDGWWADHLKIPWAIFPSDVPPQQAGKGLPMYKYLRLNLYRYDYNNDGPNGPSPPDCRGGRNGTGAPDGCPYTLTAWSPSGIPNFHLPQWFGSAELLEKKRDTPLTTLYSTTSGAS